MKDKPVFLGNALLVSDALIICDLHLGLEYELLLSGIRIPSQTEKIKQEIKKMLKKTKSKHLILLGDIKHNISFPTWQEKQELPEFFKSFHVKISVVKGNHDGNIEKFADNMEVYGSSGMKFGNMGLLHGQGWPKPEIMHCKYLVIAHNHPMIEVKDKFLINKEQCWLVCKPKKEVLEKKFGICKIEQIIFMPAFNKLLGGMAFNKKDFKPIGPVFKFAEWKKSEVFLTDGTFLGTLDKL